MNNEIKTAVFVLQGAAYNSLQSVLFFEVLSLRFGLLFGVLFGVKGGEIALDRGRLGRIIC